MTIRRRKARALSDVEEARIRAGVAADPDNPEWTAQDFRRAKPFATAFPALAKSRRGRGPQKKASRSAGNPDALIPTDKSRGGLFAVGLEPRVDPRHRGIDDGVA